MHVSEFVSLVVLFPDYLFSDQLRAFVKEAHETIEERRRYLLVALALGALASGSVFLWAKVVDIRWLDIVLILVAMFSCLTLGIAVYLRTAFFKPFVFLDERTEDELERLDALRESGYLIPAKTSLHYLKEDCRDRMLAAAGKIVVLKDGVDRLQAQYDERRAGGAQGHELFGIETQLSGIKAAHTEALREFRGDLRLLGSFGLVTEDEEMLMVLASPSVSEAG